MCGRYAATANLAELVETYDITLVTDDGEAAAAPSWNVAPTDRVAAVLERLDGDEVVRKLVGLRWGLVPSWSKDTSGGARMINARVETIVEKPAFRKAVATRRCIVPALGYYEWRPESEGGKQVKQPYLLRPDAGELFSMAGIYEFWRGPEGWLSTVSIITTSATDELGWVHDRMPMTPLDLDAWLDPSLTSGEVARELLVAPSDLLPVKVSGRVNSVANNDPGLIEPLA